LDFCLQADYHICCITESWLKQTDRSIIASLKQGRYDLVSIPRSGRPGGGIAVMCDRDYKMAVVKSTQPPSFESAEVNINCGNINLPLIVIYRPPANPVTFTQFMSEFDTFLGSIVVDYPDFLMTGDFNIHMNDPDSANTRSFNELLNNYDLQQHVGVPIPTLLEIL
jgi:exonuclease III